MPKENQISVADSTIADADSSIGDADHRIGTADLVLVLDFSKNSSGYNVFFLPVYSFFFILCLHIA